MAKKTKKKVTAKKAAKAVKKPAVSGMGVQPLGDRVIVRPLTLAESGHALPSGIIIPDTADKEKPEQGTVVAVGPGKRAEDGKLIPMSVKIGDKVMFSKYGYDELKFEGNEYFVVSENNILVVLK